MTRRILLVDIGDQGLPDITPVPVVPASWVPIVYVAPPPAAPANVIAQSVADGVLLTWAHIGGRGISFKVERAIESTDGPLAWVPIASSDDLTCTVTVTAVEGFWFRVRAVRNGRYSEYSAPVFQYAFVTNPPPLVLEIEENTITLDCRYKQFILVLDRDVENVLFSHIRTETTLLIDVEQSGGGNRLEFPPHVRPIDGVPYRASPVDGSVDVIGLKTVNTGQSWRLTAQQPAGGGSAFAAVVTPSPAEGTAYWDNNGPVAPSVAVTLTQKNGVDPVTVSWQRSDLGGGEDFICSDRASFNPEFSIEPGTNDYQRSQLWTATLTDRAGRTLQVGATLKLQRIVTWEDLSARLVNGDLEQDPLGWDLDAAISRVEGGAYSGRYSLVLNTDHWGQFEGVNQYSANVSPGDRIQARCMIRQGASDKGNAGGWVRIKWYAANGGVITNDDGNNVYSGSGGAWHPSTVTAVAPANAARARLAFVLFRNRQNRTCQADLFQWARL